MRPPALLRRAASEAKHRLFPAPEVVAWRHACRAAAGAARHTPGAITLDGYRVAYADLLTLCPQWRDIFVERSLRFTASHAEPRILDCGANVGLASLFFKRLYPGARMTAFEADPSIAALCRRNLDANGAQDVEVRAAAVWTHDGDVRFTPEGADSGAIDGVSAGLAASAAVTVPAVRLRDVLAAERRIDLLKVDIEGAEHAVIADCAHALGGVAAMLIDVHEFDTAERRMPHLLERLTAAGFHYAVDNLVALPWRASIAKGPFEGLSSAWAALVRAWRPSA